MVKSWSLKFAASGLAVTVTAATWLFLAEALESGKANGEIWISLCTAKNTFDDHCWDLKHHQWKKSCEWPRGAAQTGG